MPALHRVRVISVTHTAEPGRGLTNLSKEFVFHSSGPQTEAALYTEYRWLKRKTEELEKEEEEADNCLNRKSYFFSRFQISTSTWSMHQGLNRATVSVPGTSAKLLSH